MKTNICFLLFAIFYLLFAISCEKVNPPYKQQIVPNDNDGDTDVYVQKILIEDFTGHRCGNCPKAHDAITQLKNQYPGRIISIAIHAGSFADTLKPPATKYLYNFKSSDGDELATYFNSSNIYPSGLINRKNINNTWVQQHPTWASIIDTIVNKVPKVEIEINNTFDTISRLLTTKIHSDILISMNKTLMLCVYLTEDSIISWQTDYRVSPPDVQNYVHHHALRAAITNVWGEQIFSGVVSAGKTVEKEYTYTLKPKWKSKHCSVVAFVYDDETKEIIQVEEQGKIYILLNK